MFVKLTLGMKFFTLSLFILIGLPIKSIYACNPDDELEELSKTFKKTKISYPVNLSRVYNDALIVSYTQQLTSSEKVLNLKRESTKTAIQYVSSASRKDKSVTHLLAQGVCKGVKATWSDPFTTTSGFPGISNTRDKKIDWVSKKSTAKHDNICYVQKPEENIRGGHAEPQLINDINALFIQNSDAVVKLFTPPTESIEQVYMCGLEIFGPYDMCDRYNKKGNNKYDCVGQLLKFRKDHQKGQQSISKAIRNKLGNRFKGKKEDAFVVIYHAQFPYDNVDSYRAESEKCYHRLNFEFAESSFMRKKNNFDNSYSLSQLSSTELKPDILYGYIHCLGDKKAIYNPKSSCFSFR